MDKIKLLTISDNPVGKPTGVGMQTRYMIEGLLKTGKYSITSLGVDPHMQQLIRTEEYGDAWEIMPVKKFGDVGGFRSILRIKKPDIVWFMTDPHYYYWLWNMENEVRKNASLVYYHVWDNYPYPLYNAKYYDSTDHVLTISKLTSDIVRTVSPDVGETYLPHAVDPRYFKRLPLEQIAQFRKAAFGKHANKFIFFWNNRNQRRKMAATLIWWFKDFLDKVGHDKAVLIMHTNPKEVAGPDLEANIQAAGLDKGQILLSTDKFLSPDRLALLYNASDCGINISDAEGFGLNSLESLACGTPMVSILTGGLRDQIVTDEGVVLGVGIEPCSKTVIGSQTVPYVYEDRLCKDEFVAALETMIKKTPAEMNELGEKSVAHVAKNFNFETYQKSWDEILSKVYEQNGPWGSREYKAWKCMEV